YARSFDALAAPAGPPEGHAPAPSPGCGDIDLDPQACALRLPDGVQLDLGGIAKGHTADLVVDELMDRGASGAVISVGGDVRVTGLGRQANRGGSASNTPTATTGR